MQSKPSRWLVPVFFALVSTGAFAESYSAEEVPEVSRSIATPPEKPVARSLSDRFAVELSATMSGTMGGNSTTSANSDRTVYVSDSNFALGVRRFFSENFAWGISYDFGAEVMDGGRDVRRQVQQYEAEEVYLHPLLIGFRYQSGGFAGSDLLRPFGEFGFGPTLASLYDNGIRHGSTRAYLSARALVGLDAYFSRSLKAYAGVRGGYLGVNHDDYSSLQASAVVGYLF